MVKRSDYLQANRGRRFVTPGFILLARPRGDERPAVRIGLTVSKKVGNAVVRNRVKRRFRALTREILPLEAAPGTDYVMIGRTEALTRDFAELGRDLKRGLAKLTSAK